MNQTCHSDQGKRHGVMRRAAGSSHPRTYARRRARQQKQEKQERGNAEQSHVFGESQIAAAVFAIGTFVRDRRSGIVGPVLSEATGSESSSKPWVLFDGRNGFVPG